MTHGKSEIIMGTKLGKAIRFNESKVRSMGRTASGVIGVDLNDEDGKNEVIRKALWTVTAAAIASSR
jgi:DNA gyrase subunit A